MAKSSSRTPSKPSLSRAGKDAHSSNAKTRKEAMEVLALAPCNSPQDQEE